MATYEMLWDCSFCGAKKNLGKTHRHCPACGAAQDEKARYFPEESEQISVEGHIFEGADKECPACGSPMGAKATHCGSCGSPLDGAKEVARVASLDEGPPSENSEDTRAAKKAKNDEEERRKNRKGCLIATILIGGFLVFAAWMGWSTPAAMEVTSQRWQRTVAIERFGPVERSTWCSEVPSAGRVTKRTSRTKETKKVPDGEDCKTVRKDNGDGTFSTHEKCTTRYRSEAIEAPYCDYLIEDWSLVRTVKSEGNAASARNWPLVSLVKTGQCIGCEREGRREEKRIVHFRALQNSEAGKGTEGDCEVSETDYAKFSVGSRWNVGVRNMGGLACDEIEAPDGARSKDN